MGSNINQNRTTANKNNIKKHKHLLNVQAIGDRQLV